MSAHTPGPWTTKAVDSQGCAVYVLIGAPASMRGKHVAFAGTYAHDAENHKSLGQRISANEALANARLIAAAPDLLAALERIVALNGCTGGKDMLIREYKHIASTAIAKAKGQS